jgi:TIR domain
MATKASTTQFPCLFDPWNPCVNIKEYRKLCRPVPPICEHIREAIVKPGDVEFYVLMDSKCYSPKSTCAKPETSQLRLLARWEAPVNRSNTKYKKLIYNLKSLQGNTVYFPGDNGNPSPSLEKSGELYVFPAYNKVAQSKCGIQSVAVIKKAHSALQHAPVSVKVRAWNDEEARGGKQQELILEVAVPPDLSQISGPQTSAVQVQAEPSITPKPIKAFISYAREDERVKNRLVKFFRGLKNSGLDTIWHDGKITAGKEWLAEIKKNLDDSQIILLLVSLDFLSSEIIETVEMKRALERHASGEARVIPIIVAECDWPQYEIAKLETLPTSGKAMSEYPNNDRWFTEVKDGLRHVLRELSQ